MQVQQAAAIMQTQSAVIRLSNTAAHMNARYAAANAAGMVRGLTDVKQEQYMSDSTDTSYSRRQKVGAHVSRTCGRPMQKV